MIGLLIALRRNNLRGRAVVFLQRDLSGLGHCEQRKQWVTVLYRTQLPDQHTNTLLQ